MKALMITISVIISYSPLGSPTKNYVASVQEIPYEDCLTVKKNIGRHNEVICAKREAPKK